MSVCVCVCAHAGACVGPCVRANSSVHRASNNCWPLTTFIDGTAKDGTHDQNLLSALPNLACSSIPAVCMCVYVTCVYIVLYIPGTCVWIVWLDVVCLCVCVCVYVCMCEVYCIHCVLLSGLM